MHPRSKIYCLKCVRHSNRQLNVAPPSCMRSLLNSNELCAIKNGEVQFISLPFESALRYCGRKYPGYWVGMIHGVEQPGTQLYLVFIFILFSVWKLII